MEYVSPVIIPIGMIGIDALNGSGSNTCNHSGVTTGGGSCSDHGVGTSSGDCNGSGKTTY